ncbi:MAG TPA: thiamine phosphate synthase [Terriglobales bacterium]|nr:thiamine phosphate synthase [Terriglobales bacterium]
MNRGSERLAVERLRKPLQLPRLYPIVDVACFSGTSHPGNAILDFALAIASTGVFWLQYRNKSGNSRQMLSDCRELRRVLGVEVTLVMNDRADLALAAGFDGVHVGQDDLPVQAVRRLVGAEFIVGTSTHNPEQLGVADQTDADYVAIGPVYATSSKANPDPVVGLDGVRLARSLTRKPLVAIGGITRANCRAVLEAGADSVAVISDLVNNPQAAAEEFLRILL